MRNDFIGYRIRLKPTKKQKEYLNEYFGIARFVYNKAKELYDELNLEMNKDRKDGEKWNRIGKFDFFNKHFNPMKKSRLNAVLNNFDSTFIKLTVFDLYRGYERFYKREVQAPPKFKTKKYYKQSFPIRGDRLDVSENYVFFPNFREGIRTKNVPRELIGSGNKGKASLPFIHFLNPRLTYDGCSYWLTFSVDKDETHNSHSALRNSKNEVWKKKKPKGTIGIDLGTGRKNWIVDSNGTRITRVDTSKEDKKIKKLQKILDKKMKINNKKFKEKHKSDSQAAPRRNYMTKNELKIDQRLNRVCKHKSNMICNQIYEYSNYIVMQKPEMVVMEDLSVKSMMRDNNNKPHRCKERLNRQLSDAMLYTVKTIVQNSCENNNIGFMLADKEYPSSQLCSSCGHRLVIGRKKVYKCPVCGMVKDRDENASINLAKYPYNNSLEEIA